jgi:undecaprenyl-diphosphatase
MWTLKQQFRRNRPLPCGFPKPEGYSFPSGHALVSFCFFMVLAAMITAEQKAPLGRVAVWVIAAVMVFGIGLSRIYLCAHYPSDVVAGYLAALVWVLGVTVVYRRLPRPIGGRLHQ